MSGVVAVYGDGPFREIGQPDQVSEAAHGGLIAVGGSLGLPQWHGYAAHGAPVWGGPVRNWHRVGVYDATTLECRFLVPLHWPVHSLAFDPLVQVLAIGTGSYDGGYFFQGELVILDLATGRTASVLDQQREVLGVEWLDSHRLTIVLSPASEAAANPEPTAATLQSDRWNLMAAGSVVVADLATRPADPAPRSSTTQAADDLTRLAERVGRPWDVRRQVWSVEPTSTGILSCCEGVEVEAWTSPHTVAYRHAAAGSGRQLVIDGDTVVTNVEPPWGPARTGFERSPSVIRRIEIESGRVLTQHSVDAPCILTSAEGSLVARDTRWDRQTPKQSVVFDDSNPAGRPIELGGYDLFNHYFAIRRAPHHLALEGRPDEPSKDKWVVRVRPLFRPAPTQRLFPLEWDPARDGHLQGGPGVFISDADGDAIVHSGHVHSGQGLLPGQAFVVRRSYPDGAPIWLVPGDCQAVGLDESGGLIAVAFLDGTILRIDAESGAIIDRHVAVVNGHPVAPLSLAIDSDGRAVIGTMDGRIVVLDLGDCRVQQWW